MSYLILRSRTTPRLSCCQLESGGYSCAHTSHKLSYFSESKPARRANLEFWQIKMTGFSEPSGRASLPTANSTKSFWHSDPSAILLGHRTSPSLPTQADVVIIGSGISGSSAGYFLRQDDRGKDLNIVMLEAREACWGATGRVSHYG